MGKDKHGAIVNAFPDDAIVDRRQTFVFSGRDATRQLEAGTSQPIARSPFR